MNIIDARGLSCPEPVILTMNAIKSGEKEYKVLVDNHASKENVTRYAQNNGYSVDVTKDGEEYTLNLKKD